jgi:catechol 2,3-dioxygenase-like lactoylglutathione lyase family enzyme
MTGLVIDHVNIVVRDLDRMVAFYTQVLGMTQTKRVTIQGDWIEAVVGLKNVVADVVYLEMASGPRIELIKYQSPESRWPDGLADPSTGGFRHMAFLVDDIDKAYADFAARGVNTFIGKPQCVSSAQVSYTSGIRKHLVYFRDPEGNVLEFCEYRKPDKA